MPQWALRLHTAVRTAVSTRCLLWSGHCRLDRPGAYSQGGRLGGDHSGGASPPPPPRGRATFEAQKHSPAGCVFFLALAWRLYLERLRIGSCQHLRPATATRLPGADFVDGHVRNAGARPASAVVLVSVAAMAAPLVARVVGACVVASDGGGDARALWSEVSRLSRRRSPGARLAHGGLLCVHLFVVYPSPLLREQPFPERSIAGTRYSLGLYACQRPDRTPHAQLCASDFPGSTISLSKIQRGQRFCGADSSALSRTRRTCKPDRLRHSTWSRSMETRSRLWSAPARLDLTAVHGKAGTLTNDRLAYTHGWLILFSAHTEQDRGPRLLDPGRGYRSPGSTSATSVAHSEELRRGAASTPSEVARLPPPSSWVRRQPVVPSDAPSARRYVRSPSTHYTGPSWIPLSHQLRVLL